MHDLTAFTLQDMARSGAALRKLHADCRSMEDTAQHIVQYFFTNCVDKAGQKQCALVRFFKTHPYDSLEPELQAFSYCRLMSADKYNCRFYLCIYFAKRYNVAIEETAGSSSSLMNFAK